VTEVTAFFDISVFVLFSLLLMFSVMPILLLTLLFFVLFIWLLTLLSLLFVSVRNFWHYGSQ